MPTTTGKDATVTVRDKGKGMTRGELKSQLAAIDSKVLGQLIVEACKRDGISQAEAARRLDVHPQAVSDWINQRRKPAAHHVPKLAQFLKLKPSELRAVIAGPRNDRLSRIEQQLDIVVAYVNAFADEIDQLNTENARLVRENARLRAAAAPQPTKRRSGRMR